MWKYRNLLVSQGKRIEQSEMYLGLTDKCLFILAVWLFAWIMATGQYSLLVVKQFKPVPNALLIVQTGGLF